MIADLSANASPLGAVPWVCVSPTLYLGQNFHCHSCPAHRSRVFASLSVFQAWSEAGAARAVLNATGLAESAGLTIHELQKERGMSAGFVASKGQQFSAELPPQRQASDGRMRAFQEAVARLSAHGAVAAALDVSARELKQVEALRKSVSGFSVPAGEAAAAYTRIIASLLSVAESIGGLSNNTGITQAVSIYTATIAARSWPDRNAPRVRADSAPANFPSTTCVHSFRLPRGRRSNSARCAASARRPNNRRCRPRFRPRPARMSA